MKTKIAVATDKGLYILKPGSEPTQYTMAFVGINGQKVRSLAVHPNGRLYAGTEGNFIYSTADGNSWTPMLEGLSFPHIETISIHPTNPDVILCGTAPPTIWRSEDGGNSWSAIQGLNGVPGAANWTYPGPTYRARVRDIVVHPQQDTVMLAAVRVGGIGATLDGGNTWVDRHAGLSRDLRALLLHPQNPSRLYAAAESGVYRSDDLGGTWSPCNKGIPYLFSEGLCLDPNNGDRLILLTHRSRDQNGAAAFVSENGGDSWEISHSGLGRLESTRANAVACTSEEAFIGTQAGEIYGTTTFGKSWACLITGIPPINAIAALNWS